MYYYLETFYTFTSTKGINPLQIAENMNDLSLVTVGSCVTVKLKGLIYQMTVTHVSRCQIDVTWLYKHDDLGWIDGVRHFTRKGKLKYIIGEDSEIISLDIIN